MVRKPARSLFERLTPPDRLRIGPLREGAFKSPRHDQRTAAWLGMALGITFSIAFITGLLSHFIQYPPDWFVWPSRPAGLYRVTQGLHVVTGLLSIPLLLAKLWVVFPHFWTWPPVRNTIHLIERISLLPLVGGSLFLLFTGLANIGLWYPWQFFFPAGHYSASWITIGALIVHIGAKATITRMSLRREHSEVRRSPETLARRRFLGLVGGAGGLLTLTTVGQTFAPLNPLALLAPRRPDIGPQGFPVNKTADGAGVTKLAQKESYRLIVEGAVTTSLSLSLEDLQALPQRSATLPIACVEGWSASELWEGVPVRDILAMAGAGPEANVTVTSIQPKGLYKDSELNRDHAHDEDTLIALRVNGETLHLDHGYPARLIGPNRPGVMQTKWVGKLTVH